MRPTGLVFDTYDLGHKKTSEESDFFGRHNDGQKLPPPKKFFLSIKNIYDYLNICHTGIGASQIIPKNPIISQKKKNQMSDLSTMAPIKDIKNIKLFNQLCSTLLV